MDTYYLPIGAALLGLSIGPGLLFWLTKELVWSIVLTLTFGFAAVFITAGLLVPVGAC